MKYIKVLGLAVVAAMAFMALVGAGSASATVLCKTTPEVNDCPKGWDYEAGTTIKGDATGSTLIEETNGVGVTTCTNGSFEGVTENTGGASETVRGKFQTVTLSGCSVAVNTISLGIFEIHANDEHNAVVTGKGTEITINTSLFGSCVYTFGTQLGTFKAGKEATLNINTVMTKTGGGFACPADTRWTSTYNVTGSSGLYFATTSA